MFRFTPSLLALLTLLVTINPAFGNSPNPSLGTENIPKATENQPVANTPAASGQRITFGCEIEEGIPVTYAEVNNNSTVEKKTILSWVNKHFPDQQQAQELCNSVAEKLQSAYATGTLKDGGIYAGKINPEQPKEYVLCVKTTEGTSCSAEDLILVSAQTKCVDARAVLYDMSNREIIDTKQRPLCSGTKGDFTTRLRFNWFPF